MSERTCETCRWWFDSEDRHGRCHRYPPHPSHGFPLTAHYGMCGEWTSNMVQLVERIDDEFAVHGVAVPARRDAEPAAKAEPTDASRFRQCGWYVETAHARTLHETRGEAEAYAARWKGNGTWTLARIVPAYREREET